MSRIKFIENQDYLKNSVARPTIIEREQLIKVDFQPDFGLYLDLDTEQIYVKDKVVKSTILPTLGITGLLKKEMMDDTNQFYTIIDIIAPIFKQNIQNFIFYIDSVEHEAIVVKSMFDKSMDPCQVDNTEAALKNTLCTAHFPVNPDENYDVLDFNQTTADKNYKLNLTRIEDITKPFYPVVHNTTKIAWVSDKDTWDQRASIYDRERDLYITLPRNYGKGGYKPVSDILTHIDYLIGKMNINDDYSKEYTDMLTAKLPNAGLEFMMETSFDDHKLISFLEKISSIREEVKPGVLRALYKCLGYMVAQKIHCCKECRHLDEETL